MEMNGTTAPIHNAHHLKVQFTPQVSPTVLKLTQNETCISCNIDGFRVTEARRWRVDQLYTGFADTQRQWVESRIDGINQNLYYLA